MKTEKKRVQSIAKQKIAVEIEDLKKIVPLVVELQDLLLQLEAESIEDFENNVNALTQFTNPMVSASAFNLDSQYKRLLQLQKLIDNRLRSEDLTASKELKTELIKAIKEKYTTYYSNEDLKLKKTLEEIMVKYNSLNQEQRQQIGFNMSNELIYNPFSNLKN
tara:strand:+ start:657 stop:1145 length:489 start_codon:yes stop_codon:yes gene_type:complete